MFRRCPGFSTVAGVACVVAVLAIARPTSAQAPASALPEDVEPRVIGGKGVTAVGFSGFIDKFGSSEEAFPLHAVVQVDVTRFVTTRFAVRGGLLGATTFGGDEDEPATGPGAPAMSASAALLYYFTPQGMVSLYAGGEYRAQLTSRAEKDAGTMLGLAGVEAAVSSRARVFIEGGYGARLTHGDEGELQTRIVGQVGIRIKF